ncbi:MAG TPA: hypothetical protein VF752_14490 [Thermoleophilaceae bacterium]
MQRDVRLVIVVEEDLRFADHRASGLTFCLLDTGELWVSDGERFGPMDALACVLLEETWPDLVIAARDALTARSSRERRPRAKRFIHDKQLETLFARAAADARTKLAG